MSMITKCPACGTSFRVTPRQLQAQHGMVRCGRCATVFDGFKELATQRDVSSLEAAPPAAAVHSGSRIAEISMPAGNHQSPAPELPGAPLRSEPATPAPEPAVVTLIRDVQPPALELPRAPVRSEPATPAPEPAVATLIGDVPPLAPELPRTPARSEPATPAPEPALVTLIGDVQPPAPELPRTPSRSDPATPTPQPAVVKLKPQVTYAEAPLESVARRGRGWLVFGVFLLLLALSAQGVYFYRGDIAAYVPEARPYLNRICEQLRCTVALPQRPRSISIEASDLQATDPANSGLITLTATLRNHAATTLGYPALDVVLTNTKEHTVARRIFLPVDYLGVGKDARAGIPPNAELTVKLDIDSGDLGAAGFRLDLLAAPER